MTDEQFQAMLARFDSVDSRADANKSEIRALSARLETHITVASTQAEAAKPLVDKINETWDWKNRANGSLSTIKWLLTFLGGASILELAVILLKIK